MMLRSATSAARAAPRLVPVASRLAGRRATRSNAAIFIHSISADRGIIPRPYSTATGNSSTNISTSKADTSLATEQPHAVISTFDLFSIGVGPSSSHTVGPMRAANIFLEDLKAANVLHKVHSLRIDVYGSLAATGVGHGTPGALLMGFEGEQCETIETTTIVPRTNEIKETKSLCLDGSHRINFDYEKHLILHFYETLPEHSNGMRFSVFNEQGDMIATNEFYSIGGGFIVNADTQVDHGENVYYKEVKKSKADEGRRTQDAPHLPFHNAESLLKVCSEQNMTIAQVIYENELRWRSEQEIHDKLFAIWKVMDDCIRDGCLSNEEYLPGRLKVKRRAKGLYQKLLKGFYPTSLLSSGQESLGGPNAGSLPKPPGAMDTGALQRANGGNGMSSFGRSSMHGRRDHPIPARPPRKLLLPALDFLSSYAIAVNEQNAAGHRVVTAPTNGAAGIIPAVLKYIVEFVSEDPERDIMEFLFTAAAIGMLFKRGASISGAEAGCQGEVGVACSMAAAGFAAVMGGSPLQIENAAEIGIEHNLGLTCDPVDGQVILPCIERNALGAVKAVTAAQLALNGDGEHFISLDTAIHTMKVTGQAMDSRYKETSLGGLASTVRVPEC